MFVLFWWFYSHRFFCCCSFFFFEPTNFLLKLVFKAEILCDSIPCHWQCFFSLSLPCLQHRNEELEQTNSRRVCWNFCMFLMSIIACKYQCGTKTKSRWWLPLLFFSSSSVCVCVDYCLLLVAHSFWSDIDSIGDGGNQTKREKIKKLYTLLAMMSQTL